MFEWLFKYPPTVFLHGQVVLRSAWPRWLLVLGVLGVGLLLAWSLRGLRAADGGVAARGRLPLIWLLFRGGGYKRQPLASAPGPGWVQIQ